MNQTRDLLLPALGFISIFSLMRWLQQILRIMSRRIRRRDFLVYLFCKIRMSPTPRSFQAPTSLSNLIERSIIIYIEPESKHARTDIPTKKVFLMTSTKILGDIRPTESSFNNHRTIRLEKVKNVQLQFEYEIFKASKRRVLK